MAENYSMKDLLTLMVERNATDLLLSVGLPPRVRVSKRLIALDYNNLTPERSKELCYQVMNEVQQKKLEDQWEVDFSIGVADISRFRVNVFMQRGSVSAAFRAIPYHILSFEELSLPPIVKELSDKPNGLVLVTGPTGCGNPPRLQPCSSGSTKPATCISLQSKIPSNIFTSTSVARLTSVKSAPIPNRFTTLSGAFCVEKCVTPNRYRPRSLSRKPAT
jgi:twitching motility protein PilT